jgi:hypothetical protein
VTGKRGIQINRVERFVRVSCIEGFNTAYIPIIKLSDIVLTGLCGPTHEDKWLVMRDFTYRIATSKSIGKSLRLCQQENANGIPGSFPIAHLYRVPVWYLDF